MKSTWFVNLHVSEIGSDFRNTRAGRLTLRGLFHQKTYITKFTAGIRKRHDFKMGDWEVFNGTCNALHHEPRRLDQDQGFSEPVTLSLVLDFHFGRHGECVDIVVRKVLLTSLELRLKRWNPPMIIKNPCVIDHRRSINELQ